MMDWLKLVIWLATFNRSALFRYTNTLRFVDDIGSRLNMKEKTLSGYQALWLVKTSHMTCNNQSECFISLCWSKIWLHCLQKEVPMERHWPILNPNCSFHARYLEAFCLHCVGNANSKMVWPMANTVSYHFLLKKFGLWHL